MFSSDRVHVPTEHRRVQGTSELGRKSERVKNMKNWVNRLAAPAIVVPCAAGASADSTIVYQNNFETPGGLEAWSNQTTSVTPLGNRSFLGEFSNETVTLTVTDLPQHDSLRVQFSLYLIRTWDGNTWPGPDRWGMNVDSQSVVDTTFTVSEPGNWRTQSYPMPFMEGNFPQRTGANEYNSLGYTWKGVPVDAVWEFDFTVEHIEDMAEISFWASGLQPIHDESWGMDNFVVSVSSVPAPGILALSSGLGLLMARRRR